MPIYFRGPISPPLRSTPWEIQTSFPYGCCGSFNLNEMDDSQCLAEFRFHENDVPVVFETLQLPQSFTCQQGTSCDGIDALSVTLRRFAYPSRYSDLIPRFGRPVPELSMISNLVVDTIYQGHNHRLSHWNLYASKPHTSWKLCQCDWLKRKSIT